MCYTPIQLRKEYEIVWCSNMPQNANHGKETIPFLEYDRTNVFCGHTGHFFWSFNAWYLLQASVPNPHTYYSGLTKSTRNRKCQDYVKVTGECLGAM